MYQNIYSGLSYCFIFALLCFVFLDWFLGWWFFFFVLFLSFFFVTKENAERIKNSDSSPRLCGPFCHVTAMARVTSNYRRQTLCGGLCKSLSCASVNSFVQRSLRILFLYKRQQFCPAVSANPFPVQVSTASTVLSSTRFQQGLHEQTRHGPCIDRTATKRETLTPGFYSIQRLACY